MAKADRFLFEMSRLVAQETQVLASGCTGWSRGGCFMEPGWEISPAYCFSNQEMSGLNGQEGKQGAPTHKDRS